MDAQSLLGLIQGVLAVIFVLVCLNLYLILRLKRIDPFAKWNPNAINGALLLSFLIIGMVAAFWSSSVFNEQMILIHNPASAHGVEIDRMFWNTMWVSAFVTIVTNVLLFFFSWKYRAKEGQKAQYFPHNNMVEIIWTAVPAIVLTVLIIDGISVWHDITDAPGEDAIEIELTGEQFRWNVRYAGPDTEFGEAHVTYIDPGTANDLGFNWEDPRTHDDIIAQQIHLPVGKEVSLRIRSKDVLHSATMAHFRVKMDAVPGLTTSFTFTPTVTTDSMRRITGNPEFEYEMSCQQICGQAHWNMKKIIVVESYEDYLVWLSDQKAYYATWKEINGLNKTAEVPAEEEGETEVQETAETEEESLEVATLE